MLLHLPSHGEGGGGGERGVHVHLGERSAYNIIFFLTARGEEGRRGGYMYTCSRDMLII